MTNQVAQQALADQLAAGIKALSLNINSAQQTLLMDYLALLYKWNKAYNLSGIKQIERMVTLHLIDSLSILPYVKGEFFLDVGTGAGLPGIPLAICKPDCQFLLLDSNGKKTRFLSHVVNTLKLKNVQVVNERVENFQSTQQIDIVLTRAFSSLEKTVKWINHLLSSTGTLLAMKGIFPVEELEALPKGFQLAETIKLSVPGEPGERQLLKINRVNEA